jgi:hypothetical protein
MPTKKDVTMRTITVNEMAANLFFDIFDQGCEGQEEYKMLELETVFPERTARVDRMQTLGESTLVVQRHFHRSLFHQVHRNKCEGTSLGL